MNYLILDVGGANLVVEVDVTTGSRRPDRSGTSIERSFSGKPMVTQTYGEKMTLPTLRTSWLTTEQYEALKAAANWPETIVVGGTALRITTADTVPQTINAIVEVEDSHAPNGVDFLHIATINITEAD
jgi:hypothetical protein